MNNIIDIAETIDNPSALTQEQGDIIYSKICSFIDQNEMVILDFSRVESMISPFLNNAIGQLYGKYTSEQISEYLTLQEFPSSKKSTLNIVISNAKRFYADREKYQRTEKEVLGIE